MMLGDSTVDNCSTDPLKDNVEHDNTEKKISINDLLCDSPESPNLMERMATLPIINSLGNVYEKSKAIRVVKYSAESAESLLKPVLVTLEPALAPLDRFACNQLDKLGFTPNNETRRRIAESKQNIRKNQQNTQEIIHDEKPKVSKKWHQVVGSRMGSMMLTEDMARGIRYCMQWLQHATQMIDAQITHLLRVLAKIGISFGSNVSNAIGLESSDSLVTADDDLKTLLATMKRQVAEILKKVVEVVGKYAAVCLPGEARNSVKGFILSLPSRWASINTRFTRSSPSEKENASNVPEEAQKVLTLATESTNMLKGIHSVFESSVEFYEFDERDDMDVNFNLKTSAELSDDEYQDTSETNMDLS